MANGTATITVDAKTAAAFKAAPKTKQKQALSAFRQALWESTPARNASARLSKIASAKTEAPHFSAKESRLLMTINRGLIDEERRRAEELTDKMEYDSISDAEHKELMRLCRKSESLSVKRLEAMIELAKLRGVSFDELLKQLGIEPRKYAR